MQKAGGAEDAEVHTYEKGAHARTYVQYVEEMLSGRVPPKLKVGLDPQPEVQSRAQRLYRSRLMRYDPL